jgi:hypothetical protein
MQTNNLDAQLKALRGESTHSSSQTSNVAPEKKKFSFNKEKILGGASALASLQSFSKKDTTTISQQYIPKSTPKPAPSIPPTRVPTPTSTVAKQLVKATPQKLSDEEDEDIVFKDIDYEQKTRNTTKKPASKIKDDGDDSFRKPAKIVKKTDSFDLEDFNVGIPDGLINDFDSTDSNSNDAVEYEPPPSPTVPIPKRVAPIITKKNNYQTPVQQDSYRKLAEDYSSFLNEMFAILEGGDEELEEKKNQLYRRMQTLHKQPQSQSVSGLRPSYDSSSSYGTPTTQVDDDDEVQFTGETFNNNRSTFSTPTSNSSYDQVDYYDRGSNSYPDTPVQRDWSSYSTPNNPSSRRQLAASDERLAQQRDWSSTKFSWNQEVWKHLEKLTF